MTANPPRVEPSSFLTLHYRLSGAKGDVINTFGGKPATLSMGSGALAPAIEACLIGMQEGERASFTLAPGAAFGERQSEMQQWVARSLLEQLSDPDVRYEVGEVVQFPTPDGQASYAGTVLQVRDEADGHGVLFDFNHPLAGQEVVFEVQLIGVL